MFFSVYPAHLDTIHFAASPAASPSNRTPPGPPPFAPSKRIMSLRIDPDAGPRLGGGRRAQTAASAEELDLPAPAPPPVPVDHEELHHIQRLPDPEATSRVRVEVVRVTGLGKRSLPERYM